MVGESKDLEQSGALLDLRAKIAISMVERWGCVAGFVDGERRARIGARDGAQA